MQTLLIPIILIGGIVFILGMAKQADRNLSSKRQDEHHDDKNYYYPHRTKKTNSNSTTMPQYETTNCSECGTVIKKDDNFCPQCGKPQKDVVRCPHCGHLNPRTNSFCDNCNQLI